MTHPRHPPPNLFSAIRVGDVANASFHMSKLSPTQPWPRDENGHTALHWAAMSDNIDMFYHVASCINTHRPVDVRAISQAQRDQTPLHWACVGGRFTTVLKLLDLGADFRVVDGRGYSATTHAVHYGRVDVVHVLVKLGGRKILDVLDAEGHGLMEWAAYYGHVNLVVYFIKVCGMNVDNQDGEGMTPLHRAVLGEHVAVVEALLRGGADFNKKNGQGKCAAEIADGRLKALLNMWKVGEWNRKWPVGKRITWRKYGLVMFYWVILVATVGKWFEMGMNMRAEWRLIVCLLTPLSIASHLKATFGDPGDVPKGTVHDFVRELERRIENGTSENTMGPSAYCYTCLAARPQRSKHSRERDCCVRVFDHECPWVNNTVGLHTHKALLLLVASTAFAEWIFIYSMVSGLWRTAEFKSLSDAIVDRPLVCLLVLVHSCVSLFCVMLLITHIRLVLRGQTTYEYLTAIREERTGNPYDMGPWKNLLGFLTSTGPGTGFPLPQWSLTRLNQLAFSTGNSGVSGAAGRVSEEKKLISAEYDKSAT